jgi:hypothetical protein
VFRQAYERGRYGPSLRYGTPPPVALAERDRRWVMAQNPG